MTFSWMNLGIGLGTLIAASAVACYIRKELEGYFARASLVRTLCGTVAGFAMGLGLCFGIWAFAAANEPPVEISHSPDVFSNDEFSFFTDWKITAADWVPWMFLAVPPLVALGLGLRDEPFLLAAPILDQIGLIPPPDHAESDEDD